MSNDLVYRLNNRTKPGGAVPVIFIERECVFYTSIP